MENAKLEIGDIIISIAGNDKGCLFFVVGNENDFVLISDGKKRKLHSPKRKKLKHVRLQSKSYREMFDRECDKNILLDSKLRTMLARYKAASMGQEPEEV